MSGSDGKHVDGKVCNKCNNPRLRQWVIAHDPYLLWVGVEGCKLKLCGGVLSGTLDAILRVNNKRYKLFGVLYGSRDHFMARFLKTIEGKDVMFEYDGLINKTGTAATCTELIGEHAVFSLGVNTSFLAQYLMYLLQSD
jgi:hypothetical protein